MVKARDILREDHLISFITELYDGDLHAKRVLSLAYGTLGVLTSASLAVHAIGQGLAHAHGTLSKHGVKQVDRLLSNTAIELDDFFSHWVPHVIGAREEIVVALDWTSFARDGHDTLMLSMLTEHGRATALMWETVSTATLGIISMGRHVVVRIVTTPPWCFRVPIHRGDWPRAELFAAASPAAFLCLDLLKPYPA